MKIFQPKYLTKQKVRQLLELEELESNFSPDKLDDLVSRQNQSPGSSLYWTNLNYLSQAELLLIFLIGYGTTNQVVRFEILEKLPRAIKQLEHRYSPYSNGILLRLLQELVGQQKPFNYEWQRRFFSYFPARKVLGLLSDRTLRKKVLRRFRPRLVRPRQAVRCQRVRGYRDHGTCRPDHKWLPRADFSFNEQQFQKEQMEIFQEHLTESWLTYPFLLAFHYKDDVFWNPE